MTIVQVSSVPIVKAALLARLVADANLEGVQVKWGHPYPAPPDRESILFGDATAGDTNGASEYGAGQFAGPMGQRSREERYLIHGYITVKWHNAEEQQVVTERAYELASVIEQSLRVWGPQSTDWPQMPAIPGLNSRQVHWVQVNGLEHSEGKDNQYTMAAAHIEIAVAARI